MVDMLPTVCLSQYETTLFAAIFATAYFGYFRIGELVQNNSRDVGHAIQFHDVMFVASRNNVDISLKHSKTDQQGKGTIITLCPTRKSICPVELLRSFMGIRPSCLGSFFCHIDGAPVTNYQVRAIFTMLITKLGLDRKFYKLHSFRIGAATEAWAHGKSADQIAKGGRWKSKCMYKYIRC